MIPATKKATAAATTTPSSAAVATEADAPNTAVVGGNNNNKNKNVKPGLDGNEGTIQAIAVRADGGVVCVALQNKQLLMFRRRAGGVGKKEPRRSYPMFAHTVTEKRVTKLAFAPLTTTAVHEDNDETDYYDNNMVLVAADMLGDATAYEIPNSSSSTGGGDGDGVTTKVKRKLLLGHTASVLTDVCLVASSSSNNKYYLLTADRDEKIRVSHFPRCYDIYGYLLGHTAFVTSVTALTLAATSTTLVASTGGDGQLMVWNVEKCEKMASCAIGGGAKDATNTNNSTTNVIPTIVLALPNSTTLLVIGDRDPKLYGFTYYCDDERQRTLRPMKEPFVFPAVPIDIIVWSYNRCRDDDTPATATLVVLFQDAPYIRCYDCATTTMDNGITTTLQLTETTPEDLTRALSMAISSSSSSSSTNDMIHVPDSLLEKRGQDGIVLAKHAREYAESFSPNDPERLPGSKEKIVMRHEKRQKKKENTKST